MYRQTLDVGKPHLNRILMKVRSSKINELKLTSVILFVKKFVNE